MKFLSNVYSVGAAILGFGLIIGGWIIFGESLEQDIKILDIIASCIIYLQFVEISVFKLMNTDDEAPKEVGMMGVHFASITFCIFASIAVMVCGILYQIDFKFQLFAQLILLAILFGGRANTLKMGDKVQQVHEKEKDYLDGKKNIRRALEELVDETIGMEGLSQEVKDQIQSMQESVRFIAPSGKDEAIYLENQICQLADDIIVMLRDPYMNSNNISTAVNKLQRLLTRRKQQAN